jgi:phytoene desaturase
MMKNKKIAIVGSGFAGLTSAAFLGQQGAEVHVFEKNSSIGGRARSFSADGFSFDMGPSWYWMPDVFEDFFTKFKLNIHDFIDLKRLDPGFKIFFADEEIAIPDNFDALCQLFESIEPGSAAKLVKFMQSAEYKYQVGVKKLVYKPGKSILEFAEMDVLKGMFKLQLLKNFASYVREYFSNPKLVALMEFPILFLGAMPQDTPALYSLMNYAGLKMGTFYPMGGMVKLVDAFAQVAQQQGVVFHTNTPIDGLGIDGNQVRSVHSGAQRFACDAAICAGDYHHFEQKILPKSKRLYTEDYWDKRTLAPSSLIFYLGFDVKIPNLEHHNLFFDFDFHQHAIEIYQKPQWPSKPLFYACCPSKTDPSVAPIGSENLFLLMPIAPDLEDNEALREQYFEVMMDRLEQRVGMKLRQHLKYKRSYAVQDFKDDYHSYKGNAYGLANTLKQTAMFKPKMHSQLDNLLFTGQLTTPGPGVPPAIISGEVAAREMGKLI